MKTIVAPKRKTETITARQMNIALHTFRHITTNVEIVNTLDGKTSDDYETDLSVIMKKGRKCYHSDWERAIAWMKKQRTSSK